VTGSRTVSHTRPIIVSISSMPHPQHLVAVTLTPDGAADDVDDDDDSAWLQQLQGREADAC